MVLDVTPSVVKVVITAPRLVNDRLKLQVILPIPGIRITPTVHDSIEQIPSGLIIKIQPSPVSPLRPKIPVCSVTHSKTPM